ncbi:MAG: histidinol dehydrogenase [Gammaproteobacteria bacterium]|nr:histidinol dehydrogenase [Gammaproteobacteria bacterium]
MNRMLRELDFSDPGFDRALSGLLDRRESIAADIETAVARIVAGIRDRGDSALVDYTRKLDGLDVHDASDLELSPADMDSIAASLDPGLMAPLRAAAARIRAFHERGQQTSWQYTESDGTVLGQRITPMEKVGIYVPGGKAAYPSSVLMTAIPAKVAGVGEVVMTVPKPRGETNPAVLVAASLAGVDRIFTIGGAQAIASLAYGTETVPAVDKIVGPGNAYVAAAKKRVFGKVGIDMIAGPSEVVVICDETVDPDWVAMDLFAQAEHDENAQSIAITNSSHVVQSILDSMSRLLPDLERREIIQKSIAAQGAVIRVGSWDEAAEVANRIAPEHLELMVDNPGPLLDNITHAGAIFVGKYSAEVLGDYCAGPNHVLPTAGTARFSSPLGVYDFQKKTSIIQASPAGADEMARTAAPLARCEGLTAHERSAKYRLRQPDSVDPCKGRT